MKYNAGDDPLNQMKRLFIHAQALSSLSIAPPFKKNRRRLIHLWEVNPRRNTITETTVVNKRIETNWGVRTGRQNKQDGSKNICDQGQAHQQGESGKKMWKMVEDGGDRSHEQNTTEELDLIFGLLLLLLLSHIRIVPLSLLVFPLHLQTMSKPAWTAPMISKRKQDSVTHTQRERETERRGRQERLVR